MQKHYLEIVVCCKNCDMNCLDSLRIAAIIPSVGPKESMCLITMGQNTFANYKNTVIPKHHNTNIRNCHCSFADAKTSISRSDCIHRAKPVGHACIHMLATSHSIQRRA